MTDTTTPTTTEEGKTLAVLAKDIVGRPDERFPEDKRNNGELLAEHGLNVMHFLPGFDLPGMTVAYRKPFRGSNTLEIATAITHPKDTFTKRIGTRTAVEAFVSGRTIFVPITDKRSGAIATLKFLFG